MNINLPAKTNTFYDMHIKAFSRNVEWSKYSNALRDHDLL